MTNREAIERIKDHMRVHKIGEYPHIHIADALGMAIAALESPRDWTPCADGLPEIMKRVIVTICGEIVIAEREHELDDDETTLIHWYDDEGCRFNDDVVTAWMPMPEPWTGGLDGK